MNVLPSTITLYPLTSMLVLAWLRQQQILRRSRTPNVKVHRRRRTNHRCHVPVCMPYCQLIAVLRCRQTRPAPDLATDHRFDIGCAVVNKPDNSHNNIGRVAYSAFLPLGPGATQLTPHNPVWIIVTEGKQHDFTDCVYSFAQISLTCLSSRGQNRSGWERGGTGGMERMARSEGNGTNVC